MLAVDTESSLLHNPAVEVEGVDNVIRGGCAIFSRVMSQPKSHAAQLLFTRPDYL